MPAKHDAPWLGVPYTVALFRNHRRIGAVVVFAASPRRALVCGHVIAAICL